MAWFLSSHEHTDRLGTDPGEKHQIKKQQPTKKTTKGPTHARKQLPLLQESFPAARTEENFWFFF